MLGSWDPEKPYIQLLQFQASQWPRVAGFGLMLFMAAAFFVVSCSDCLSTVTTT